MPKKEELTEQLHSIASQLSDLVSSNQTDGVIFEEKKLFTVILSFSDHADGMAQFQANSPREALGMFIEKSEALENYNRTLVEKAVSGFWQPSGMKGFWTIAFTPLAPGLQDADENSILGGYIVVTREQS